MQEISTYRQCDGIVVFYGYKGQDWVLLGKTTRDVVSPYWTADFSAIPAMRGTWNMVQDAAKRSLAAS